MKKFFVSVLFLFALAILAACTAPTLAPASAATNVPTNASVAATKTSESQVATRSAGTPSTAKSAPTTQSNPLFTRAHIPGFTNPTFRGGTPSGSLASVGTSARHLNAD